MSIFDQFETNVNKENDGVFVDYGQNKDGSIIRFKIASMTSSNKKWTKAMLEMSNKYKLQMKSKTLSDKQSEEIVMTVFCKTILVDWENVQTREGETIPYSYENAVELMKKLPRLYKDLNEYANDINTFLEGVKEDEIKN